MLSTQRAAKFLFFSTWAVLMTAFTYILGGVSLKVLRTKFGRAAYWGATLVLSAALLAFGFKFMALAFLSLVLLIGVFGEFEEMGLGFGTSLFYTLVINSLVAGGSFAFWVYSTGPKWSQIVLTFMEDVMKRVAEINPQAQVDVNYFEVMLVLPSAIIVLWVISIYIAILLESRLRTDEAAVESAPAPVSMRPQLTQLRLHDLVIWTFIAGLLGAALGVGPHWIQALGANVLYVCSVLFFFQGIAVVAKFFETIRLSAFWQVLLMSLVILYMFPFVSLLGLADYWVDFRRRLTKQPKKQFNREV